jgi:hypothetical protein
MLIYKCFAPRNGRRKRRTFVIRNSNMTSFNALRRTPSTLLIICSQVSYEEWAAKELGLGPLDIKLISVPGGPAALAYRDMVPADWSKLRYDICFLVEEFPSIRTVIAVNHGNHGKKGGCGYYVKVLKIGPQEETDMPIIAQQLRTIAPGKEIRTFYAGLVETGGTELVFKEV